jgi:hypothetical protein
VPVGSRLQSKVAPCSEANPNCVKFWAIGPAGPEVIVVSGSLVMTVQV